MTELTPPSASALTATSSASSVRKPRDHEIDVYGLTHQGKVRKSNQDQFLICSLEKHLTVHHSSLPAESLERAAEGRIAFMALVADGVGGGQAGEEASRLAAATSARYVAESAQCYYKSDTRDTELFVESLQNAAIAAHDHVRSTAEGDPSLHGMATTLTLWIGIWPAAYLLQVGDSRCYLLRKGELRQISTDQTMAEELVKQGILSPTQAPSTRWAHVLSSAIGGHQAAPVITAFEQQWGDVGLLCSDGLTAHVSDEQIEERLRTLTSARQACEALLQDALDGGGSDNISIIVGRTIGDGSR